MNYFCCDESRRERVKDPLKSINGIDFLEVLDGPNPPLIQVHFLKALSEDTLKKENVRIKGGERITNILVKGAQRDTADQRILTVTIDKRGDFSIYTLRLVSSAEEASVPANFDPLLAAVEFSFNADAASDFDCRARRLCPPEPSDEPEIDYLEKDYASFRRLMLDRISALLPGWNERNPADLGVALVELLAYVGDSLSYRQDAVATEAYLGTARHRISARRHARLIDYRMHDGCNARVWMHVRVNAEALTLREHTQFFTRAPASAPRLAANSRELTEALSADPEVFEPVNLPPLFAAHNELLFYTFGDAVCCLPKGATSAALRDEDNRPRLRKGDVLIFQEKIGPLTGLAADADPARRHAVRLTRVNPEALALIQNGVETRTPSTEALNDPVTGDDFIEIEWAPEDALPFPFCISSKIKSEGGDRIEENVSVALGNILLADHGRTVHSDRLGVSEILPPVPTPDPRLRRVPAQPGSFCGQDGEQKEAAKRLQIFPRFHPRLDRGPVTQAGFIFKTTIVDGRKKTQPQPFDPDAPASAAFTWKMEDVLPAVTLENGGTWEPRRDLLASHSRALEFVVEVDNDGTAFLRFGDNLHGKRPEPATIFKAIYRVGNGARGNVGAGTISHIVTDDSGVDTVTNPLPASGGLEPETIDEVRRRAPVAFRTQLRAVTAGDFADVAQSDPRLQQVGATFRWTGSWRTAFVTVDSLGGIAVDDALKSGLRDQLEPYRMAGQDLEVNLPLFVSLEIELRVAVKADYFRSDVGEALLKVFNNGTLGDGRRGVFHPDNFTFGQPVFLSPIYAAAQSIEGVAAVQVTAFQRRDKPGATAIEAGKIEMARMEIARLDNDPNFPEHGVFRLKMEGGK